MEKFEDFLQKTCDITQGKKTADFVAVSWHFSTDKEGSCTAARPGNLRLRMNEPYGVYLALSNFCLFVTTSTCF